MAKAEYDVCRYLVILTDLLNFSPCFIQVITIIIITKIIIIFRSGGGVVDNTLDYQSRDRKIDPSLLRSFG